jgi:hypothetical protein
LICLGDVRLNNGHQVFVRVAFVRFDALFDAEFRQLRRLGVNSMIRGTLLENNIDE